MNARADHNAVQVDPDLLEPVLRRFSELIGLAKTMLIVEMWGGLQLYIAKTPPADGDLAGVIGLDAAQKLGDEFGGEHVIVPKAGRALRAVRDRRIRAEHDTKSIRQLCIEYNLAERRLCEILAEGDEADDQPDLFE
ncbi:Mor transcription activator family protein [Burkholderiaceae bacterium UC74_6]